MSTVFDDWQTLNPLLEQALALPKDQQQDFVSSVEDRSLRQQLATLLKAAYEESTFISRGGAFAGDLGDELVEDLTRGRDPEPKRVGAYLLVREVGRGGMAQVFLGRRADGLYDQEVAIKIMWPGLIRGDLLDRFERERQILAQLTSPHVARLLDGGVTEDGRPWLAMEYTPGERIDRFCEANGLTVPQRIALVRDVMGAVAAAHRLGVIHRDIKPANILVEPDGNPRLLDFGIAKQLNQGDAETVTDARVLTPQYASPEQIQGQPVSRESDVYQLGLLLFELLTGERPFAAANTTPLDWQRRMLEELPPRPSRVAKNTGQHLSPDLDAVVLRALDKDPAVRYSSVEDFSRDLDHYLRGLPVDARAGRKLYRARKFVARHRWAAAGATLVFLLLFGWGASMTWQARQIELERDAVRLEAAKAAEMARFMTDLFEYASPGVTQGQPLSIRAMVDRGADQLAARLDNQDTLKADMQEALGRIYTTLGEFDAAIAQFDQAAQLRSELPQPTVDHADFLEARAAALRGAGEFEPALALLGEVLTIRVATFGEQSVAVAQTHSSLGDTYAEYGKTAESSEHYRQALELRERLLPEDDLSLAMSRGDYGIVLHRQGLAEQAAPYYELALKIQEPRLGASHPSTLDTLRNLAVVQWSLGKNIRARELLLEVLDREQAIYEKDHPRMSFTLGFLARVAEDEGELGQAEDYWRQTYRVMANTYSADHLVTAGAEHALGEVLLRQGKLDESCGRLENALKIRLTELSDEERRVNQSRVQLALCQAQRGEFAASAQHLTAAEPHLTSDADRAAAEHVRSLLAARR
ncbi:MAG: serine/threonine-protein kinase [Pseudomonadota bacterium]